MDCIGPNCDRQAADESNYCGQCIPGQENAPVLGRSDDGQSLLDRAAHVTADRNKLAAELIQHAKRHSAIAKDHMREADEATRTADILLGQVGKKAKPQQPKTDPRFVFSNRGRRPLLELLVNVVCGVILIMLGYVLGHGG